MLGSLYTEKALWICLGNLLAGSRWTAALTDSFVAKQRNITRARHAHQLTDEVATLRRALLVDALRWITVKPPHHDKVGSIEGDDMHIS